MPGGIPVSGEPLFRHQSGVLVIEAHHSWGRAGDTARGRAFVGNKGNFLGVPRRMFSSQGFIFPLMWRRARIQPGQAEVGEYFTSPNA